MKNQIKSMESKLKEFKNKELGLIGGNLKLNILKSQQKIAASINRNYWGIEITVDPDYTPDKKSIDYLKNNGVESDFNYEIIKDILTHEGLHWKDGITSKGYSMNGCPTDVIYYDEILDSVTKALKKKGKEQQNQYVANAFLDTVANTTAKVVYPPFSGQVIFFYEQGKDKGYDKFYEAFVKLNMEAWGEELDESMVSEKYKNEKETDNAVKLLVDNFKITNNTENNAVNLSVKNSWKRNSYTFADVMADLIDEEFSAMPTSSHNSKKIDKNDMKKIVMKRFNGSKAGKAGTVPSYMDSYEFLDSLYDSLSTEIPILAKSNKRGFELPITQYSERPFKENDNLRKIKFSKVFADNESPFKDIVGAPVNFGVSRFDYSLEIPAKFKQKRLPDVCLIVDTSGSMKDESSTKIPGSNWTEGSGYHYALLGFYGITKYLQMSGIAPYVNYDLINFSNSTISSGWKDYGEMDKIKKLAFTPQFGGTKLDMDVVKKDLKRDSCISLMLSDGDIYNWGSIKNDFMNLAKNHYFSFISIGEDTQTSYDLKDNGFLVNTVKDKNDLSRMMIDLTKQQVKNYMGN